jgi:hypothetical protein
MSGFLCSIAGATYAPPVALAAVSFDGTGDLYSAASLSTTATDSKYLTIAFTWFHASGGNSRNQHFMTARLGTANGENGWEVCIQSGRFRYSSYDNSGASTDMVYGDYEGPTENAWNQIVAYIDHTSFANCRYYLNGVDRTSNLLNGGAIGAVNLGNNNINWGTTNANIRIGVQNATAGYNSNFSDFLGRISQIYVHNEAGTPGIWKFWNTTTNLPLDLGTNGTATGLAQPLIYHYGNTSTFPTNNGTGFNAYTLTATGDVTGAEGPTYGTKAAASTPSGVEFQRASSEKINVKTFSSNVSSRTQVCSYWFKLASSPTGDEAILCATYPSDGNAPILCELTGGNIRHYVHTGNNFSDWNNAPPTAFTAGVWNHIITRSDTTANGTFQTWINGVKTNTYTWSATQSTNTFGVGSTSTNTTGYGIGGHPTVAARLWNGCIAQVYWYGGAIDIDANITKFYNNGPVDMGTAGTSTGLPTPHIYHYGSTQATFDDVRGSLGGSSVTITGSLATCS